MTRPDMPVVGSPAVHNRFSPAPGADADAAGALRRVLDLWGKLSGRTGNLYHPLAYHLIDAAVSAEALWHHVLPAATRDLYCTQMQAEPAQVQRWLTFLVGLHDLGKATPGFQGQEATQRR
ncbi:MAG: hypothetical protein KKI08_18595, partial [Armatimonadetes bacterium]|nr:hypothetical protein [Armatimonadota bacterium]